VLARQVGRYKPLIGSQLCTDLSHSSYAACSDSLSSACTTTSACEDRVLDEPASGIKSSKIRPYKHSHGFHTAGVLLSRRDAHLPAHPSTRPRGVHPCPGLSPGRVQDTRVRAVLIGKILNSRTTPSMKYEAVPRRARIQASWTLGVWG